MKFFLPIKRNEPNAIDRKLDKIFSNYTGPFASGVSCNQYTNFFVSKETLEDIKNWASDGIDNDLY